jgi:hypothetical protein
MSQTRFPVGAACYPQRVIGNKIQVFEIQVFEIQVFEIQVLEIQALEIQVLLGWVTLTGSEPAMVSSRPCSSFRSFLSSRPLA